MGRVNTGDFSLQAAIETSPGVLPGSPVWYLLEPTTVEEFGSEIGTVERRPISKNRQRAKGVVVDKDSSVAFEHDITIDIVQRFFEGFAFAQAANWNTVFLAAAVDLTTNDGYVVPAATAAQAAKIQSAGADTLIYATGYTNAGNNGLKVLTADLATSGTKLICASQGLVAETPPTNARVEVAGIRPSAADLSIVVTSGVAVLTSAADINFTTLGLQVGQRVHVGGLLAANQFSAAVGYGWITAITAATLTLNKLVGTFATDTGSGETVDLLFGRLVRNVPVDANADDLRYQASTFQFEGAYPNLGSGGATEYEYAPGSYCNEIAFNAPLTEKATITFSFISLNVEDITGTRKTGASTPILPLQNDAFSTATDFAALSVRDASNNELATCFKSFTLTLNNNVSAEKCLGTLGPTFINVGLFEVGLEAQLLFTTKEVPNAIRANSTLTFYAILHNDDGAVAIDIPSLTFGGGNKEYPVDQSILINVTGQAFADALTNTSVCISTFPVVP